MTYFTYRDQLLCAESVPLARIAEQFGTLATLYPGRIDLGVGRAPGTDQRTARALRRNLMGDDDAFPQDVLELISYLGPLSPDQPVRAVPPVSQETLAEMIGTTRSRVNFFMKKFERLGFITYKNGLKVNNSLLTVVLHE